MNTVKRNGRIAGVWYLLIAVFYAFGMIYVDPTIYVPGDAAATVRNLQSSGLLLRLGLLSTLAGHVCFLFLVNALYRFLSPVDRHLARQMVLLVVAGVAVASLNRLTQLAALLLVGPDQGLAAIEPSLPRSLAAFLLGLHRSGEKIASVFWALWLLPLGLLILKGDLVPRTLGVLLLAACASYLVGFILFLFFPLQADAGRTVRSIIEAGAEVSFIVWLLVRGAAPRAGDRATAS